jgi:serine/threonine protein kinase/formylglycine-generating enzyme required for sulfatase activity
MPFDEREEKEEPEPKSLSFFRGSGKQARPQPAVGLASGKLVGDFRLMSLLGQGGMGQVWEADQVSLHRTVAVKFVRPERVTEKQLELFAREARAGGRLHHPGIVTVHGHGSSDGLSWIAMEFVGGAWTLRDFLDEASRLPEVPEGYDRHVARFVAEVADAMQAAHEAGVIHRDLKPQNVLITADDHPKVSDFGLARITDETALSVTGDFAGTYFYMSPEQVAAKRAGIDHRTDVFSLGIVFYELLALRRPFEGDTSHQVAAQILDRDPPDIRTIRSRVPRDLAVIAGKALEKSREKRYQTMNELAADLRRHLANEPIHATPPTRIDRTVKWVRRNPTKSTAAAIVVVAFATITWLLILNVRTNTALEAERTKLGHANTALGTKTSEAEASAAEATRRKDEVLRLSALQRLDDLEREADRLWPITPEMSARYSAWLSEAEKLLAELPSFRDTLAELRTRGTATPLAESGWTFASSEDRWWHSQLTKLIDGLMALSNEETGLLSFGVSPKHGWGVKRRVEFADTIQERSLTGPEVSARWTEALTSIRNPNECPWYVGVELTPQLGLLPIGQDPSSGLWEFAHLQTGEPAERGSDGRLILGDTTGLVFVLLPGGTFRMGAQKSDSMGANYDPQAEMDEGPVREVRLSPFFLAKYELTQQQWLRSCGEQPSHERGRLHPVERVNWLDATRALNRMDLALPTEAQWEFAARGGACTPWWTGDQPTDLEHAANLADEAARRRFGSQWPGVPFDAWDDGFVLHSEIGRLDPNPFGLHDILGNVMEWCQDEYTQDYGLVPSREGDGLRASLSHDVGRVQRGGSFTHPARFARAAVRFVASPDQKDKNLGLRPARELKH